MDELIFNVKVREVLEEGWTWEKRALSSFQVFPEGTVKAVPETKVGP
ncbi:MAG: hypothetical protein P8O07_00680 [Crocinitomicaceae bacterium]|nr:hypothetical protein [Crocinitomicaceae bacterium]